VWATLLILTALLVGAIALRAPLLWCLDSTLEWLDNHLDRYGRQRFRDTPTAALLLAPALIVLAVFGVAPLFYSVYLSLFQVKGLDWSFVFLGNYEKALASSEFWDSFLVTIYYVLGTIPLSIGFSFLVASLLFRIVRGRGILRTLYFLPYVTAVVASATVWRTILHPQVGLINGLLGHCGLNAGGFSQWLLEPRGVLHLLTDGFIPQELGPSLALCCVIIFEIWHSSGFMVVILLAGLTAIPRELEEAAKIDGANWFQVTRSVTIPLLSPTIFFLTIISTVKAFQAFNSFYALTGNGRGPLDTTQNVTVHIYSSFYEYGRIGYGAAVATLLAACIVAMTLVQWRFVGRKVHYE
jgi:multiple sugar transport system permease protein